MLWCSSDCRSRSLKRQHCHMLPAEPWYWLQCCHLQGCCSDSSYLLVSICSCHQQGFGVKAAKKHLFRANQKVNFLPGSPPFFPPLFLLSFLFAGCSVLDRHLQSSLEDMHQGGQSGVNLSNSASCLSGLGFPVWSQLSAFTVLAAENYQAQEQVTSPKRHFSSLYFSPSLATAFWISCGSYSSHMKYPGKLCQRRCWGELPLRGPSSQPFSAHSQVVSQEGPCSVQAYQSVIPRCVICVQGMPRGKSTTAQLSTAQESAGRGGGWDLAELDSLIVIQFPSPSPRQPGSVFGFHLRSFSSALNLRLFSVPPDPG